MVSVKEAEVSGVRVQHEVETLKAFALRWSVLAAWRGDLLLQGVPLPEDPSGALERARVKLATGCFSACEVGCDLAAIEAVLTVAAASTERGSVDFWVDLLGQAMKDQAGVEQVLRLPAIQTHYQNCGVAGCACAQ